MQKRVAVLITVAGTFIATPLAMASPAPAHAPAPASVQAPAQAGANTAAVVPVAGVAGVSSAPSRLPKTQSSTSGLTEPPAPVPALTKTAVSKTGITTTVTEPMLTTAPPTAANQPQFGLALSYTLSTMTPAAVQAEMASIKSLGVGWIRVDLDWSTIQPSSPALFNWTRFDTIVSAANADGISVLPTIGFTPAWARSAGCNNSSCAPSSPTQFAIFAAAAVARYSSQGIHTWEIWNEPNLATFWQPTPSATAYVALLKATTQLMRYVDPSVKIISGGLARAHDGGGTIAPLEYLQQFCAAGGPALVDGIGFHPYSYPGTPDVSWGSNAWLSIDRKHPSVESILQSYGAGSKPIWLTEYGAPTGGPGPAATIAKMNLSQPPSHVDQALQALMVTQSVQSARSDPHIAGLFWYSYQDLGTSNSTVENFFGLRTFAGKPKLAWFALQKALRY